MGPTLIRFFSSQDFIFFQSTNKLPLEIANEDAQVVIARVTGFQAANRLAGELTVERYGQPKIDSFSAANRAVSAARISSTRSAGAPASWADSARMSRSISAFQALR